MLKKNPVVLRMLQQLVRFLLRFELDVRIVVEHGVVMESDADRLNWKLVLQDDQQSCVVRTRSELVSISKDCSDSQGERRNGGSTNTLVTTFYTRVALKHRKERAFALQQFAAYAEKTPPIHFQRFCTWVTHSSQEQRNFTKRS